MEEKYIILVDNTQNLEKAYMTPKLIKVLETAFTVQIISSMHHAADLIRDKHRCSQIKGVVLSGGPLCLSDEPAIERYYINTTILSNFGHLPVLGICFGFQIMAVLHGSSITRLSVPNSSMLKVNKCNNGILTTNMPDIFSAKHQHNDYITRIPPGFEMTLMTNDGMITGIENKHLRRFGFQFHPEATEETHPLIKSFMDVCS